MHGLLLLKEGGFFEEIDCYGAKRMLSSYPSTGKDAYFFICFLLAISRQGHLCLNLKDPHLAVFLQSLSIPKESLNLVEQAILSGAAQLPKELVEEAGFPLGLGNSLKKTKKPLYCVKDLYYVQKNWEFETSFFHHVRRLLSTTVKEETLENVSGSDLNEEQLLALKLALTHSFSIISGGPGTGKTFTAARIVRVFLMEFLRKKTLPPRIYLAAPTGKAAFHLKRNVLRYFSDLSSMQEENFFCSTLHQLLNVRKTKPSSTCNALFFADFLLVDECSMIDAELFSLLLASVRKETTLILMGDKHQLPPVETGSFFAELVEMSKSGFPIPCAELQKCMRSDRELLLEAAKAVEHFDEEKALKKLLSFRKGEVDLLKQHPQLVYSTLWQRVKDHFLPSEDEKEDPQRLLRKTEHFRILSSLRQGPYGVDALNQALAHYVWQGTAHGSRVCLPILITRTDRSLNLLNGETGILMVHKRSSLLPSSFLESDDEAFFWNDQGQLRRIPAILLASFEYAFCLSVHKSQGSEFDHVLLLIPPGTESFGREVLYTAMTRAKNSLQIEGDEHILRNALKKSSLKISGLQERGKMFIIQNEPPVQGVEAPGL